VIEVGKYNRKNTNADFDCDLVVEGVVQARKKYVNSSTELTRENFSEILVLGENFCGKIMVFSEPVNA